MASCCAEDGLRGDFILGILGSVVGGLVGRVISKLPKGSKFHPAGFVLSLLGAIVLAKCLASWR